MNVLPIQFQYQYNNYLRQYTVPVGVNRIAISAWGSGGASRFGRSGGAGAYAEGTFSVTPGQILVVAIGGPGTGWLQPANGSVHRSSCLHCLPPSSHPNDLHWHGRSRTTILIRQVEGLLVYLMAHDRRSRMHSSWLALAAGLVRIGREMAALEVTRLVAKPPLVRRTYRRVSEGARAQPHRAAAPGRLMFSVQLARP